MSIRLVKSFTFGNYNNSPITWLVLKQINNRVLLLSEDIIDYIPFNNTKTNTLWDNSSIRSFLNSEFLSNSFTKEELSYIIPVENTTTVKPLKNNCSFKTEDTVFLLDENEVKKYIPITKLKSSPTEYTLLNTFIPVKEQKATVDEKPVIHHYSSYWLRSNGSLDKTATIINAAGHIELGGINLSSSAGLRPAIWVTLDLVPQLPEEAEE
ncbi:MAG: DUF6273 domain-containing protein [Clostridia bacterium]|nr:DUF6273 domain-containing protein [Clostridia bacterium]